MSRERKPAPWSLPILVWIVILPFLLFFPLVLFWGWVSSSIQDRRKAGNPPLARPGHRLKDRRLSLLVHPRQRRRKRKQDALWVRRGMKGSKLPLEVCEIIIDWLHSDERDLSAASRVCAAWTGRAYHHLFRSIRIQQHRAYTFVELLRSPYRSPSFVGSFRDVKLYGDSRHWNVVESTLLQLVQLGVPLRTLDITLNGKLKSLRPENIAPFQVTALNFGATSTKAVNPPTLRTFIEAYSSLTTLSFDLSRVIGDFHEIEATEPLTISPRIHTLVIKFHEGPYVTPRCMRIVKWILHQNLPKLTSVHLLGNVRRHDISDTLRTLFEKYRIQIRQLGFSVHLTASKETPLSGLSTGVPDLLRDGVFFPNLKILHIECVGTQYRRWGLGEVMAEVGTFIAGLLSLDLEEVTIGLDEASLDPLKDEDKGALLECLHVPGTQFVLSNLNDFPPWVPPTGFPLRFRKHIEPWYNLPEKWSRPLS